MAPGIHLMHKPVGPTSFSLVQSCIASANQPGHRRIKICHGGTLDPFASGLLLMLAGPATRLFEHLHDIPKVYEATVRWGIETDNGDPLGRTIFTGDASSLSISQLEQALARFVGWQEQVPPTTSAKRVGGERAYVRAHRGETFDMPTSRVYLHKAHWLEHDLPRASRIRLVVRGGYYVRSLARDLGRLLACGAHLSQLHRTSIGPWNDPGPEQHVELHGRQILPWLPSRALTDQEVGDLRQERTIATGELIAPDWSLPKGFPQPESRVRGFHLGRLIYLLQPQEEGLGPLVALAGGL